MIVPNMLHRGLAVLGHRMHTGPEGIIRAPFRVLSPSTSVPRATVDPAPLPRPSLTSRWEETDEETVEIGGETFRASRLRWFWYTSTH